MGMCVNACAKGMNDRRRVMARKFADSDICTKIRESALYAEMSGGQIALDPAVLKWALGPIFFITTLATMLRQGLTELNSQAASTGGLPAQTTTLLSLHTTSMVNGSKRARAGASYLSVPSLLARKVFYLGHNEDGRLCRPPKADANPLQSMMAQDPSKMAGTMKYSMIFLVLNAGLAYLISYLFSEGVVARTPFPLTRSFKSILQRGVDVENLDPNYVTSLSLYFLVLFCSSSYLYLLNYGVGLAKGPTVSALEGVDPMFAIMNQQQQPMGGAAEPAKVFGQEADSWKVMSTTSFLAGVEDAAMAALIKA